MGVVGCGPRHFARTSERFHWGLGFRVYSSASGPLQLPIRSRWNNDPCSGITDTPKYSRGDCFRCALNGKKQLVRSLKPKGTHSVQHPAQRTNLARRGGMTRMEQVKAKMKDACRKDSGSWNLVKS